MTTPAAKPPAKCDAEGFLNETQDSCIKSHAAGLIPVVYEIKFDKFLPLPYAIKWNDRVQPAGRVARLIGHPGKIRVFAKTGQTVGIYLGADASPEFRNELLYPVTVGANHIKVVISDKGGLNDDKAMIGAIVRTETSVDGHKVDVYKAQVTGDVWMRFSHKYTVAEALAIAAAAGVNSALVRDSLSFVYGGQAGRGLDLEFAGNGVECKVRFADAADGNCRANIKGYAGFSEDCLPRVHPHAWIVLFQALEASQSTYVELSSSWRPRIGAIVHRLGLGLDITQVKNMQGKIVVFNKASASLFGSAEEKAAHTEMLRTVADVDMATKEIAAAKEAAKKARPEQKKAAEAITTVANDNLKKASGARAEADMVFEKYRKVNPNIKFYDAVLTHPLTSQLFDPVQMDANTHDQQPPTPNLGKSDNETLHNTHMHITVSEKYFLPVIAAKK